MGEGATNTGAKLTPQLGVAPHAIQSSLEPHRVSEASPHSQNETRSVTCTTDMKVTDHPRGVICENVLNSRARTDGHLNKEVKVDEGIGV